METAHWITIGLASITIISSWCQFFVKERLFNPNIPANDIILTALRTRNGILFITLIGIVSGGSVFFLFREVFSPDPITRGSVFSISALTALSVLNIFITGSLYNLRKLSEFKEDTQKKLGWRTIPKEARSKIIPLLKTALKPQFTYVRWELADPEQNAFVLEVIDVLKEGGFDVKTAPVGNFIPQPRGAKISARGKTETEQDFLKLGTQIWNAFAEGCVDILPRMEINPIKSGETVIEVIIGRRD